MGLLSNNNNKSVVYEKKTALTFPNDDNENNPDQASTMESETPTNKLSNEEYLSATEDLVKIYGLKQNQDSLVEVFEINYNPMPETTKKEPLPRGSFGPFPLRTDTDKIMYGCGISYLTGLTLGGAYGASISLKHLTNDSFNVWKAMFLNHTTRYGPRMGNSFGVIFTQPVLFRLKALGWTMFDSLLGSFRKKSDYYNHISAAFLAGSLYKCTAGIRPSLLSGTLFASVIAGYKLYDDHISHIIGIPKLADIPAHN